MSWHVYFPIYNSYMSSFIMYCRRNLLLFTCEQGCLQTCKYGQSLPVMETYVPTKVHVDILLPS